MGTLRMLVVADPRADAVHVEQEVVSSGHEVERKCVSDENGLLDALAGPTPDLVLIECDLPGLGGNEALEIVRSHLPDVPIVMVLDHITQDREAELLSAGASEVVLRSNLSRLGPVVAWELAEARFRRDLHSGEDHRSGREARYRQVIETANEGVWEVDDQLRTTFVNSRMAEMLGFQPEEMLGRAAQSFLHPEELADHVRRITERREGQAGRYERRFVRKDGNEAWALVAAIPIAREDGTFAGSFAMLTDITELKRSEQELRKSRARYQRIFEDAALGIFESTPEGLPIEVNPAFAETFGFASAMEMLGEVTDIADQLCVHPSDRERIVATLLAGERIRGWEVEGRKRDGQRIWAAITAGPVRGITGRVVAFEGTTQDVTQRRLASEALQESEEKYRLLVESANEAISIAQDGALCFVNNRMCELSGFSREELTTGSFAELIYPEDRAFVLAHHRRRLNGDDVPELYDFRFVTRSGEVRWAQNSGVVIAWQGRPATLNFFVDVTERHRVERELELKSAALEAAANAVLIINQHGIVLWANPAFTRMSGFGFGDVVGRPLREIQPGPAGSGAGEDVWAAMATGKSWHGVVPACRRDGSSYVEETTLTPVTDAAGDVTHFVAIKEDVTQRYRAAELQHAQLELLQTLMNAMPSPVFYKDVEGRYRGCNLAFASFVGRTPDEVGGCTVYDLWRKDLAEVYAARDRELLGRGGSQVYEGRVERADGDLREVVFNKACFSTPDGSLGGLVGVIVDVTDQRQLQQQLFQAQKTEVIGRLAGGVAHDFNNVLQAILSLAQVLSLSERDAKKHARLKEIEEHVRRGAQLTRQLLLFSRRETVRPERLDLEEVVAGTMGLLRRLLRENVQLETERTGTPIPVFADRGQIEQVVVNLALNGADAMPNGGRLVIRTASRGEGVVVLEVEDTGSGIAEDVRARIFEPFFTTKGTGRGSGLGLAVVDGIVSQLGGRIELETEVGRGSLFRLMLPRLETPVEGGDGASPQPDGLLARGHGEQVLIIEDEPGARTGLAETLTFLGYSVTAVATGEEALDLPAEPPMHVVLSDLVLPGLGGVEVVRQLSDRWQDLAVIFMSGYTDDQTVQRQAMDGSIRFLHKPFDARQIAAELASALAERSEQVGRGH